MSLSSRVDALAARVGGKIKELKGGVVGFAIHGADANVARPDYPIVIWIGEVNPANAMLNDLFVSTVSDPGGTVVAPTPGLSWSIGTTYTPPPGGGEGDVAFGDERIQFVLGPLTYSPDNGGEVHDWMWLEDNAENTGLVLGDQYPALIVPGVVDEMVYHPSTVAVANGSAIVTGTNLTATFTTGQTVYLLDTAGYTYRQRTVTVDSATQMTLDTPWDGVSQGAIEVWRWRDPSEYPQGYAGFTGDLLNANYYDLAKCLYIHYYRTGNAGFLTRARKVVDAFWTSFGFQKGHNRQEAGDQTTSRHANLESLMVRAMELDAGGVPHVMWEFCDDYVAGHQAIWMRDEWYPTQEELYYGVRPAAYTLQFMATLAKCMPDTYLRLDGSTATDGAARRAFWTAKAADISYRYFCRLQYPREASVPRTVPTDGSWRWSEVESDINDSTQPFQSALLIDALRQVHRLIEGNPTFATEEAAIANAIVKGADELWLAMRRDDEVADIPGIYWKGPWYHHHGGTFANPSAYSHENLVASNGTHISNPDGYVAINDNRSMLQDQAITHAYAYYLTGDPTYLSRFEYVMYATWAPSGYPGTDGYRGLQDYLAQPKHFAQGHRGTPQALAYTT